MATNRYEFGHNPEGEPELQINMKIGENNIELNLDYESCSLFTHKKEFEHMDHVFVAMEDTSEYQAMGAFIWRQLLPDWEDLKDALVKEDFQHIHKPYPEACDVEQYEKSGLTRFQAELDLEPEPKLIEEATDKQVAKDAMVNFDHEWRWFAGEWGEA